MQFSLKQRPALLIRSGVGWAHRKCFISKQERVAEAAQLILGNTDPHLSVEFATAWDAGIKDGKLDVALGYRAFEQHLVPLVAGTFTSPVQTSQIIRARGQLSDGNRTFRLFAFCGWMLLTIKKLKTTRSVHIVVGQPNMVNGLFCALYGWGWAA